MPTVLNGRHLAMIEPDIFNDETADVGFSFIDRWAFQRWSDRRLAKANRPTIGPKYIRSNGVWVRQ